MIPQLPLAVSLQPETTLEDFIAGRNEQLLAALRDTARQPRGRQLYLFGPPASGRSHLLTGTLNRALAAGHRGACLPLAELEPLSPELLEGLEELDLLALDDLQAITGNRAWEEALFNLFNRAREAGTALLFSADRGPARLELQLPDLASRLAWGGAYRVHPLDDAGRQALLLRQAERRGLGMQPDAAAWMVSRCSRDPRRLLEMLNRLDRAALAARRRLTLPFVRQQLG